MAATSMKLAGNITVARAMVTVLKGLAQDLYGTTLELWELIKKQYPMVGKTPFPGPGYTTPAYEGGIAYGVMGRASQKQELAIGAGREEEHRSAPLKNMQILQTTCRVT